MIWNTMIVSFTNIETFSWKSLAKCTKKGKNSMTSLLDRCLLRDLISIDWFRRSWWAPCMKLRSFSFTSSFRNPLFRAERRVWKLFSPDSWCLLKILLWTSIHYFSVKSLTSSIFGFTHIPLFCEHGFPRGFLRSQGMADWFWDRVFETGHCKNDSCQTFVIYLQPGGGFKDGSKIYPQNIEKTGTQGHAPTG